MKRYLAPLNSDIGFKKVFGDPEIAKFFLQDLLNVVIEEISLLATDFKITDAAAIVRFDFRCKINGEYVIIEMQQAYKTYLIKRFYLYHCLSTALQLEFIKDAIVEDEEGNEKAIHRYTDLKPAITIVWMVESNFGFTEDFFEINPSPKAIADFIKDDSVWVQDKEAILQMRNKLLGILNQTKHDLDFHAQNRLIYVFQKNIIKNKQNKAYYKWFDFAQKTLNPNNQIADFQSFVNNKTFSAMIQRLTNTFMPPADLRRLMGDEAYEAAKKLGAIQMEEDRKAKIYDDFYQEFGPALQEKEDAERWKLTMAYQEFGKQQREAMAKIALIEQEKEKVEQEIVKTKKEAEEARALIAKEKQEKKDAINAAKKEKLEALKIQKKAEQALKKALKAEEHQKQLVLIQKMLKKGETVAEIADLLDVTIPQLQKWINELKK